MRRCLALLLLAPLALVALGCGDGGAEAAGGSGSSPDAVGGCDPDAPASRFISCVVSYNPGSGAGWGQDRFPAIVEGPPVGGGLDQGSLDVLTLGRGGEITVGFGGGSIVDGEGPDFVVFENPFFIGGDPTNIYKELGVVSVSDDGETWIPFPCKQTYPYTGCGGWRPVISNPDNGISPFDPAASGGEAFDLADIGVKSARFVRIRDISFFGGTPTAGFDLDAIAIIHPASP